jgi:RNA polymerase-interacting CarD/CdnL/TRCF family regulator
MAVGENSVSDGKAVYGKLTDVNEFLVYKVVVITDDHAYYKILVDAGNGEALYVSDMIKKDNHKKISDKKHSDKAKKYFKGMSDEQIAEKKRQFKEMGDAFRSLSLQDRAALILHFMQMKLQWDGMSEDEKAEKRLEMKAMFKEYLPLTAEEKKQKLQTYIQSLN